VAMIIASPWALCSTAMGLVWHDNIYRPLRHLLCKAGGVTHKYFEWRAVEKSFLGTYECIGLKTPPARRQRALYTVNLEERREGEPVTLGALASVAAVHHLVADDHRHTRLEHRVHCRRLGPLHRVADHVRLKAARRFRPREGLVGLQLVPKRGREAHAARPRPGGREGLGWDEG